MSSTKNPTVSAGDMPYCSAVPSGAPGTLSNLVGNTTAVEKTLMMTSSVPSWGQPNSLSTNIVPSTKSSFPSTGKVGEIIKSVVTDSSPVSAVSNDFVEVAKIALTDGVWQIGFVLTHKTNGVTLNTVRSVGSCLGNTSASSANCVSGVNIWPIDEVSGVANFVFFTQSINCLPCTVSGSTLTWASGGTMTLTNSYVYLNSKYCVFTPTPYPQLYGVLFAVRLA